MSHKKLIVITCLMLLYTSMYGQAIVPDSVPALFAAQLKVFPQEKIYLHTDKPYYLAGEKIWFRAHVVDAAVHVPVIASRYVYVEMIDPLDSVLVRVKIRPDSASYHGYIPIPEDIPGGAYELRAYTNFMRSVGEEYFCTRNITVTHPMSRYIRTDTQFEFKSDKKVSATFRFSRTNPQGTIIPENINVAVNGGKAERLKPDDAGAAGFTFNMPVDAHRRMLLLEAVYDKYLYRQYINVPLPDDQFDIAFYPEGGATLQGTLCRVAFKALKSNGQPASVTGIVYDNEGKTIVEFKSDYLGMGSFVLHDEAGKKYHAMVKCDGEPKRFDLPAAQTNGYALACLWAKNRLHLSVLKPASVMPGAELYVVAHTRGLVHFIEKWDWSRTTVFLQKDQFPSGVLHLLLLDAGMNPLSERLVFVNNGDQAQVSSHTDKENYASRSLVENTVEITGQDGNPLTGSFSVAVTDDSDVRPDTTSNILAAMLLASDLRGHIENPAYYFRPGTAPAWALELLMMTQGWRRYDVNRVLKQNFTRPTSYMEIGPEISGMVKTVLLGKYQEGVNVAAMSLTGNYFETAITDKDGRFFLHDCELPDSTRLMIQAIPSKGAKQMELILRLDQYPARTVQPLILPEADHNLMAMYADKAEQKYTYENGIRMIYLSEVTVTADRKPLRKSEYYSHADNSLTEEQIDKIPPSDIRTLLMRLPGVMVSGSRVSIRGQGTPLLVIDGVIMDIGDLDNINVLDVAQVDVLKSASNTAMFGTQGGNGVIVIFTREGKVTFRPKPFHMKALLPLGYQSPVAFYAPNYDTPSKRANQTPDLRTTIHWQPNVISDSDGTASFRFYTADTNTSYTVIIEGMTTDGKVIRHESRIKRTLE